jgi:hypothetical protein
VEPQLKEMLNDYGPICEIFFDTPALMTPPRAQRLADLVHSLQPACLIDGRLGVAGDYATMGDNGIPKAAVTGDWETPGELNHNWGFDQNDSDYKSPSQILFNLLEIVSKGGNYLLDVGPTASGVIPVAAEKNLESAGRWLKVNGDAIYGAGPSPFEESVGGFGRKFGALDRILYNLINNACRHSARESIQLVLFPVPDPQGENLRFVRLNALSSGDRSRLRGADWHALFRAGVSTTGSGLGLNVAAEFVANAFGLATPDEAVAAGYLGAQLLHDQFAIWFHWPIVAEY